VAEGLAQKELNIDPRTSVYENPLAEGIALILEYH
jgi:hypothetical protein